MVCCKMAVGKEDVQCTSKGCLRLINLFADIYFSSSI